MLSGPLERLMKAQVASTQSGSVQVQGETTGLTHVAALSSAVP